MLNWLRNLWAKRPMLRYALNVTPGDAVRLRHHQSPFEVCCIDDCVNLEGTEVKHAIVHTRVDLSMSWRTFVREVTHVNGRKVW